ncbi:MAG: long-chain fatty acid--CoA ligase [Thermocrispum agreste]|uniref:Long-chain fatty acid--CoA ligase n=2 Tax=Thermocrispum agreste TaxID=37925 RepID=A0ABD6F9G4_9PSEU
MDRYTLAEVLRKHRTAGSVNAERIAVTFEGASLTYDELDVRSDRVAAGLRARGFAHGDRVGVLLYNRLEWLELFFAVAKLGGVVVPINYLLKRKEVEFILDDCQARWLVFEKALADVAPVDGSRRIVTIDTSVDGGIDYQELLSADADDAPRDAAKADDLVLLQYTSGTTGTPKGAMHTHSTVLWNSFHQIVDYEITAKDVYLIVPALCWAAGLHDIALATLWRGGRVVLSPSTGFEPTRLLATVQRERVTATLMVPTVLKRVLAEPTLGDYDTSSLRLIVSGGEPVPVTAIEDAQRKLPNCAVLQVYGMSEFPTMMSYLPAEDAVRKLGSAGRACSAAELRIVDDKGNDVPPGVVGEIICRSPANMIGYYNRPEATKAALAGGWLHTGDLATYDEEGYIFISGRAKDMIISGGLNVYPAEVERVLAQHDDVIEAAVVGKPDDKWGEVGDALVVVRPGATVTEDELLEHMRAELANYKIPKRITLTTEPLPRTTSGKVQKFRVKELLQS